jgi:hypothetical protein
MRARSSAISSSRSNVAAGVPDCGTHTLTVPSWSLSDRSVPRDTRLRTASFVIPNRSAAWATVIRSSRPASCTSSSPRRLLRLHHAKRPRILALRASSPYPSEASRKPLDGNLTPVETNMRRSSVLSSSSGVARATGGGSRRPICGGGHPFLTPPPTDFRESHRDESVLQVASDVPFLPADEFGPQTP